MTKKKKRKVKSTRFRCHAPDAKTVFLAGTFNDWQTDATPLIRGDDGTWKTKVELDHGRHEFKFLVDGQWCCEPNCQPSSECAQCVPNEFGTMNRFVDVG